MSVPSPICTIGGNPTPADVGASTTVNGALANPAGANLWFLAAIAADELTGSAGLAAAQASLSINQSNKTFSFTSPSALGTGVIFMSTVGVSLQSTLGLGRDANGVVQAAYTTTFKVSVLTGAGKRVIVVGELLEQSTYAGWIAEINAGLRAISGASANPPLRKAGNYVILAGDSQDLWLDTSTSSSGYAVTFPTGPFDGQRQRFKDNGAGGSWSNVKPAILTGATGQKVENPNLLGTLSGVGGTQSATVPGGALEYAWGATETAWLVI
jgi:hypothetical protein